MLRTKGEGWWCEKREREGGVGAQGTVQRGEDERYIRFIDGLAMDYELANCDLY